MSGISSVTVYCGSAPGSDPSYIKLAQKLGKAIAARGWRTVYGGGNVGLMGAVAPSARDSGGKVLGVRPHFLRELLPDPPRFLPSGGCGDQDPK